MSAIECALTGRVTHLEQFEDDYPRCLRNAEYQQRAEVLVKYQDDNLKSHSHHIGIDSTGDVHRVTSILPALSHEDALLFADRCYLSQHRLGRLLEIYQASSKGTEQHLVRFARELLSLDVLENLINGLYVVKDERRLKGALPAVDALQTQSVSTTARIRQLEADRQLRDQEWRAAIAAIEKLNPATPDHQVTRQKLEDRIEVLAAEGSNKQLSARRQLLQQQRGQLEGSIGFLVAVSPADRESSENLTQALLTITQRTTTVRDRLSKSINIIARRLAESGWTDADLIAETDIDRRFQIVQAELRRQMVAVNDELAQRNAASADIQRSQNELIAANTELQSLTAAADSLATSSRKRVELLQAAIAAADGDTCPVCSRNYSEVDSGDLASHLREELVKLGLTIAQLESQAARRVALETTRDSATRRIAAANQRLADSTRRVPNPEPLLHV